jgi:hypothetical protein
MLVTKIDKTEAPTLRSANREVLKRRSQWQRPYRILFAIPDLELAEPLIHDLVAHLDPRRFESVLCVLSHGGTQSPAVMLERTVIYLPLEPPLRLSRVIRGAVALAYELRARDIDVVHAFRGPAEIVSRLAARLPRLRPAVVTTHDHEHPVERRALRALGIWTRSWSDRCVVPTLELRDFLVHQEGVPANCIAVIPHGAAGTWATDVGSLRNHMVREHTHLYATLASARRRALHRRPRRRKAPSLVEIERGLWG